MHDSLDQGLIKPAFIRRSREQIKRKEFVTHFKEKVIPGDIPQAGAAVALESSSSLSECVWDSSFPDDDQALEKLNE